MTSTTATTVGYMVGRFNPLQKGHLTLLNHVRDSNDHMVILVGSAAERRTHKNPLSYEERKSVLQSLFPKAVIMPLPDMPDDNDWVANLKSTIGMAIGSLRIDGPVQPRIYSADASRGDDFALRMSWATSMGHEVVPFEPVRTTTDLSASLVRDAWYNGRYDDIVDVVPPETFKLIRELDINWMRSHYVKKVPTGERADINAVCVAFVSEPDYIYRHDPASQHWGNSAWDTRLSMLGYAVRWNGELGFVGGFARTDEDLVAALLREARNEVDTDLEKARLEPVCTHAMTGKGPLQHVHLYLYRLTAGELFGLRRRSLDARHGRTELSAFAVTHMTQDAPDILLQQQWAGTAKDQLKALLWSGLVPAPEITTGA